MNETNASGHELSEMIQHARRLREKYLSDPHRPGYHFVVPEGVHAPVDPNGALFWKGRYHMFYIYQDEGKHLWGHASSIDLVHWRHHPPALVPGDGDDGIFSGGAFIDKNGVPTITYWGLGKPDGICVATSTDDLLERWTKHPRNPVIPSTQWGLAVTTTPDGTEVVVGTADPSAVWIHDGRYYMLTGNLLVLKEFGEKAKKTEHLGDTAYLFVSDDLTTWTYLHKFYESNREWTREFEDDMCPDFFPLPSGPDGGAPSGRHMLLFISHTLGCQYYLGNYAADRFTPETHGRMTWVDNEFFAPESLVDPRGRRIMWSWIFDRRSREARDASGWSGELSLPRLLWQGEDGTLRMRPPPELERLRHNHIRRDISIEEGVELLLRDLRGSSFELHIEVSALTARQFGAHVCRSPDGEEQTSIYYDADDKSLKVDTRRSSLGEGTKAVEAAPFELRDGEALSLRIFVDKSIVEVFVNDRQAIARRIYPSRPDSLGVSLFARGGGVNAAQVDSWDMMPSNPW